MPVAASCALTINKTNNMTLESQSTNTTKQTSQPFGVPVAIVVAGALIAAAVYFGSPSSRTAADRSGGTDNSGNTAGNAAAPAQPVEPAVGEVREVTSEDHIRGSQNAKVTVVEYSDLECPFCKRFHPTMQQLLSEYPDDVRWVYRHAPLAQLHSKAAKQAEATECAGEQGKFWEMTDKIFEVTPSNDGLDMTKLSTYAQEAGVANIQQFQLCLDSDKYAQHVQDDLTDAQKAGMRGTPYSVVLAPNGEKFPINGAQPYASVKQVVDKALVAN